MSGRRSNTATWYRSSILKTYEEYDATAKDGRAFSNGTLWEMFQWNVCQGNGSKDKACVNDENEDCPLILLSLSGRVPAEWSDHSCSEYESPAMQRKRERVETKAEIDGMHYEMF